MVRDTACVRLWNFCFPRDGWSRWGRAHKIRKIKTIFERFAFTKHEPHPVGVISGRLGRLCRGGVSKLLGAPTGTAKRKTEHLFESGFYTAPSAANGRGIARCKDGAGRQQPRLERDELQNYELTRCKNTLSKQGNIRCMSQTNRWKRVGSRSPEVQRILFPNKSLIVCASTHLIR